MTHHQQLSLAFCAVLLAGCGSNAGNSQQQQPDGGFQQGQALYELHCSNCHAPNGMGLIGNIPPLANSDYLVQHLPELPCLIKNGIRGEMVVNGKKYNGVMAGITSLTDVEVTNIINYVSRSWGNEQPYTTIRDVQTAWQQCK